MANVRSDKGISYLINRPSRPQVLLILILFTSWTTIYILYSNCYLSDVEMQWTLRKHMQIPKLTSEEIKILENLELSEPTLVETYISDIVQHQIASIQQQSCQGPNMECGLEGVCGIGCQMHHRIACLIMSYATNLPLIHTVKYDDWPFSGRWSEIFRPLGSNCSRGTNTLTWGWGWALEQAECYNSIRHLEQIWNIPFPLYFGIPIDTKLADILERRHLNPLRWIVGQFTKYVMAFNDEFLSQLKEWKTQAGFFDDMTIVGLHVRRGDKTDESPDSHHEIQEYMDVVESYFANSSSTEKKAVFVASDDKSVLSLAKEMYPSWKFIGFESNFSSPDTRIHGLFEIMRDIALLSDCDHVVCGLSSNVCRLLQEMLSFKHVHSSNKMLTSLDGSYHYLLYGGSSIAMKLWKI